MTERAMPEEGFLRRWARRKSEVREGGEERDAPEAAAAPVAAAPVAGRTANLDRAVVAPAGLQPPASAASPTAPQQPASPTAPMAPQADQPAARPLPTLEDVAALDADSDFSAFVARGVDQAVRRSALKKLFADPHFNAMDRLDVYIDDYTKPSPMSEAMLASLEHAKSVLMKMVEEKPQAEALPEPQTKQPPEQETQ
jgi:hypothetical protein